MHTLDKVIVCKNRKSNHQRPRNFENNRLKMLSVLDKINYKQHIRDNLMKNANDGTAFYYFETGKRPVNNAKFLSDYDIANIVEINEMGLDVSIIALPVDWCRICGRVSNRYRCAFNLRYFDQFTESERKARLQAMPKEIRDGWQKYDSKHNVNSPWLVLNDTKTIITKVNASINQPWGVPMAVTAFDDILYAEYFVNTKRTVLDNINNQIIYMTFPEGKEKGTSSLSKDQQKDQHEKVKDAVINRKSQSGISFFSLASGTKLDKMDVDIGIFDEKNESSIKNNVPADLGMSSASLDGNTKGNYATASLNLELVASHVYTWIENFMAELNKCINANIIKDSSCIVSCYILPTTFANRDKQVQYMKDLYSNGKGSFLAWVTDAAHVQIDVTGKFTGVSAQATQLETSRYIFGKLFNGTSDVAGQAMVYGWYNSNAGNRYASGGLQIRENNCVQNKQSDIAYAPSIGFHWSNRIAATLLFHSDGNFYFRKQNFTDRATIDANLNAGSISTTTANIYGTATFTNMSVHNGGIKSGLLHLQGTTSASIAYGANNPKIKFVNSDGSQIVELMYTDYDSVRWPAGLAVRGNQGNEYFDVPHLYASQVHVDNHCALQYDSSNQCLNFVFS